MHNPNGIYVHEPDEKNVFAPYFPPEVIRICRKDFRRVISRFPKSLIRKLKTALINREVDGSFAWSDLMGTLAKLHGCTSRETIAQRRLELHQRIRRIPGVKNNDFEYWFFQISGRPSLGESVDRHLCQFTKITVDWCEELLKCSKRKNCRK